MPAPATRYGPRASQFVRMWKLLVLLRGGPRTLQSLAASVGASHRTVRRDLEALDSVGLPIGKFCAATDEEWLPNMSPLWYVGELAEWPKWQATPTEMLRRSPKSGRFCGSSGTA